MERAQPIPRNLIFQKENETEILGENLGITNRTVVYPVQLARPPGHGAITKHPSNRTKYASKFDKSAISTFKIIETCHNDVSITFMNFL